jgi:23S rRNA (guanosine2251-2'-O)-methyltransferase
LTGAGSSRARRLGSGQTKKGKPRPGTGGQGRRKLEGKGPTPPAAMRPGHPAARRASAGPAAGTAASAGTGAGAASGRSRARGYEGDAGSSPAGRSRPRGYEGDAGSSPAGRSRPRGAGEAAEFVAGRNPVVESLRAGVPAAVLYVGARAQHDERVAEAIALAAGRGVPVLEVGLAELDRLTGGAVHQGLALRVRAYDYAHPDDLLARAADAAELPLIAALDGVTDPRNLGAVVRSAAAFGAHGVVVPARRGAGVTAGAWKASAGALARVPVARAPNLARALQSYRQAGVFVAGLDAAGDTVIRDLELASAPLVLVIGSEGRGLSRIVAQACDVLVRIPIAARTESLNAGVAAGIALYEVAAIRSRLRLRCPAGVAQQAEQPSCKRQASGSNPLTGSSSTEFRPLLSGEPRRWEHWPDSGWRSGASRAVRAYLDEIPYPLVVVGIRVA